jgi:hypothetical protein
VKNDQGETSVFIKAGVVVATAAVGILAVSPLAFASDDHGHHHHGHGDRADVQGGLVNLQHIGVQVPVQLCNNSILEGTLGVLAGHQRNSDSHDGKCSQRNSDDD